MEIDVEATLKRYRYVPPDPLLNRLKKTFGPAAKAKRKVDGRDWLVIGSRDAVPTMADIIAASASYFKTSVEVVCSSKRNVSAVRPRQVAMYLCRAHTVKSFPQIGRALGGRDHTTVLHGVQKMERLLNSDPVITRAVADIRAKLGLAE
jgi:hypothetical protein